MAASVSESQPRVVRDTMHHKPKCALLQTDAAQTGPQDQMVQLDG